MKNYRNTLRLLMIGIFLSMGVFFVPELGWAQSPSTLSPWQERVDLIKKEIASLLDQNKKLNDDAKTLKEKLSGVKEIIKKGEEENAKIEKDNQSLRKELEAGKTKVSSFNREAEKLQKELAVLESQNKESDQRLSELEKTREVLKLKISDLELEKRKWVLDLKLQEALMNEFNKSQEDQMKGLQQKLQESQKQEQSANQQAQENEAKIKAFVDDIKKIEQENKELNDQIAVLRIKKDEQLKKNLSFQKENEALLRSLADLPPEKVKEKSALESKVKELESQLQAVKVEIQESSSFLDKKRMLIDEIIKVDSENQSLRQKITELREKSKGLE